MQLYYNGAFTRRASECLFFPIVRPLIMDIIGFDSVAFVFSIIFKNNLLLCQTSLGHNVMKEVSSLYFSMILSLFGPLISGSDLWLLRVFLHINRFESAVNTAMWTALCVNPIRQHECVSWQVFSGHFEWICNRLYSDSLSCDLSNLF